MKTNPLIALEKAIAIIGTQAEFARLCGVKPQTVHCWRVRFGRVPAERVLQIESLINKAVTRFELRPDIYQKE